MPSPYTYYASNALKWYFRHPEPPESFRSEANETNWKVCEKVVKECDPQMLEIIREVYTSADTMGDAVFEAAKRAGLEGLVSLGRDTVKDDFAVFLDAGCPAVNLIDFDFGSAPGRNDYWHTPQDTMDKISEESLLKAGMLVAELLNMLEGNAK